MTDRQETFEADVERISDQQRWNDDRYNLHPPLTPLVDAILLLATQVRSVVEDMPYAGRSTR